MRCLAHQQGQASRHPCEDSDLVMSADRGGRARFVQKVAIFLWCLACRGEHSAAGIIVDSKFRHHGVVPHSKDSSLLNETRLKTWNTSKMLTTVARDLDSAYALGNGVSSVLTVTHFPSSFLNRCSCSLSILS